MALAEEIERDPRWLPHALDLAGGRMQFLRIERQVLSQPRFLADYRPSGPDEEAWLTFAQVQALRPRAGALHFIFHTAFCRSTVLVRVLEKEGLSAGLAEPHIIAALAGAGEAAASLVKPVCDLLSRPWSEGKAVFVKPTNHANRLIPALLAARPDAKAVLLTNDLAPFLASVAKRGLMGRRWGRQLYLELMGYAPMDFGMNPREQFSMTDLQAASLGWFLSQGWFAGLLAGADGGRLRTLNGDRFNGDRAATIAAIFELSGVEASASQIGEMAESPHFRTHAKLGGDFDSEADAVAGALSPIVEEEIAQMEQWISTISGQAGMQVPLPQTLF